MSSVTNTSNWVDPLGDQMAAPRRSSAVLVVDDEPGMRNFLLKALEQECALVETADSVESAEQLRQRVGVAVGPAVLAVVDVGGVHAVADLFT